MPVGRQLGDAAERLGQASHVSAEVVGEVGVVDELDVADHASHALAPASSIGRSACGENKPDGVGDQASHGDSSGRFDCADTSELEAAWWYVWSPAQARTSG